jgi:hypothetical protein
MNLEAECTKNNVSIREYLVDKLLISSRKLCVGVEKDEDRPTGLTGSDVELDAPAPERRDNVWRELTGHLNGPILTPTVHDDDFVRPAIQGL